ncbi:MAG: FHA domain-containing protein [Chloroflexi bacterium]|nr:FHA domain-containing protein [Chloroflexota bacterium]
MFEIEMPTLIMQEGQEAGRSWPVEKDRVTIGRSEDCDVVLIERQVSRRHAQIRRLDGQYVLEDLGSRNGTYVNGREVTEPYVLQDGDEIQIALCVRLSFVGAEATAPLVFEWGKRPGLYLDKERLVVLVGGRELGLPLSLAQYRLLELLYDRAGQVCSRDEIVAAVWPEASEGGVSDQAIDALVRRLRERVSEVDPDHQYIVTVRGHGFRLDRIPS